MSRLASLLLPLTLLLALPAAASGQTFNVGTAGELVAALDAADTNDEDDVIEIAAGPAALANAAGYAYNAGLQDEDNTLVINGHGRAISGSDPTVMLLNNFVGTGTITVNDLRVEMEVGNQTGLDVQSPGTIRGLEVTGTGTAFSNGLRTHRGLDARDVTVSSATQNGVMVESGTATFTNLQVTGAVTRLVYSYGALTIDGATLGPGATMGVRGVVSEGDGTLTTVRHATLSGLQTPVVGAYSGDVTITDSLIRLPDNPSTALWTTDGGSAARNTSTILGERLTIAGTGAASQGAAVAEGGNGTEVDEMRITLRDSIVTGVQDGAVCNENNAQSVNAITLERVNQAPAPVDENTCDSSSQSGITRTDTTALDPGFVNAAGGDYRLRSDSPLLDRGPAAAALPGLPAADLDGAPRLNDGDGDCTAELDLGAFETQAPTAAACLPPAPPSGGGAGATTPASPAAAADRIAPALTRLKVAKTIRRAAKPPVTIRFRLDETATVTLRFRRAKGKRFVAVPGAITLKLGAGDQRVRFAGRISRTRKLAAGAHQVVISATDAAGNRAPEQRATFRLT